MASLSDKAGEERGMKCGSVVETLGMILTFFEKINAHMDYIDDLKEAIRIVVEKQGGEGK